MPLEQLESLKNPYLNGKLKIKLQKKLKGSCATGLP